MGEANELSEIAGRYQISEKLGEGAFGTVCRAKDTVLGRMVAIKTVRMEGLAAAGTKLEELKERFRREAQVAAQLKHPNIVTIYDIGQDGELNYIAMEFIDGRGLEEVIRQSGRLPLERVVAIGVQVAEALDYAHRNGVVHRDIKPANVMLEAEDHVKVTDFGIAKPLDSVDQLTATGSLLGTPAYMSPEQARGENLDGRSDLFSLGCILYEMAVGTQAFHGNSITSLLLKIVTEEPRPVREALPSLPEPFAQIITRAIRKDRQHRYASGKELAKDLTALGSVTTISELETLAVSGTSALSATVPSPPTEPSPAVPTAVTAAAPPVEPVTAVVAPTVKTSGEPPKRRGPVLLLLGVVGVLVLMVGALAAFVLSSQSDSTPRERRAHARGRRAEVAEAIAESRREARERAREARDEARETLEGLDGFLGDLSEFAAEMEDLDSAEPSEIIQRALSGRGLPGADSAATAWTGLMIVVQAENRYHAATGRYGTLEEIGSALAMAGGEFEDVELHEDHADAGGVRYELRLTEAGFEATGTTIDDEAVRFVTDQTGVIRAVPIEQ